MTYNNFAFANLTLGVGKFYYFDFMLYLFFLAIRINALLELKRKCT